MEQGLLQLLRHNRLQQIRPYAIADGLLRVFKLSVPGDDNKLYVFLLLLEPADHIKAVQPRHLYVNDHDIRVPLPYQAQACNPVISAACHLAAVPVPIRSLGNGFHGNPIVIYDHYLMHVFPSFYC